MFETSKDILNIVIAISVATFTFFVVWTIYYLLASLRNVFKITKTARKAVQGVGDLAGSIKEKVNSSGAYLTVASDVVKNIFDLAKEFKGDSKDSSCKPEKKKKKKNKKE